MHDQQQPTGGQSRSHACYNCGILGHYMVACPEQTRKLPAGLAAARATGASSSPEPVDDYHGGQGRPFKRQKTGAVITKYPPPSSGPVVTRFTQAAAVQAHTTQPYHGVQPVNQYPQAASYQQSLYGSSATPQPNMGYQPYIQQSPYGQPIVGVDQYGHAQATGAQGYDASQPYGQATTQASPVQYGTYPPDPAAQQYGYQAPQQYITQPVMGQAPQGYHQYHGSRPHSSTYTVTSSYAASPQPQVPQYGQQWTHSSSAYSWPPQQPGQHQYQQPFAGNPSMTNQSPYQAAYGSQNYQHPFLHDNQATPYTGHHRPYPQQYPATSGPSRNHRTFQQHGYRNLSQNPPPPKLTPYQERLKCQNRKWEEWNMDDLAIEPHPRPAIAIAYPLPDVLDDELISPSVQPSQGVVSKYVRANNLIVFQRGVRQSLHWPTFKQDPSFVDIPLVAPVIEPEHVEAWMWDREERKKVEMEDELALDNQPDEGDLEILEDDGHDNEIGNEPSFELSEAVDQALNAQETYACDETRSVARSGTPCLQRSSGTPDLGNPGTPVLETDDDAWVPQPGEGNRARSSTAEPQDPTEVLLAALGVTGEAKPTFKKPPKIPGPLDDDGELVLNGFARQPTRQDSGYVSARGSYSNGSASVFDYGALHGSRQIYNENQLPPPPPRYPRNQCDGPLDTQIDGQDQPAGRRHSYDYRDGGTYDSSPLSPKSAIIAVERSIASASSTAKKPEPLRQVDDVTPKIKRRQPKVADAYSRRW